YNCCVDAANSKTILFIKQSDKPRCASNHGNVDDCLVCAYYSATSSTRILSDDDIIDELLIILCSSLTCSLFNEFVFSFDRCNNV
ncbi:unnamed protein product, partial [Rotaria sp. Silwood1]